VHTVFRSPLLPPPLPPWEGVHPLVVHFPLALLLVAPLFVLLSLLPKIGRGFAWAGLLLLVLGTTGAYVAVESGEAAAELAVRTPEINEVIKRHQDLAETTRLLFTIVTAAYALVLLGPALLKKTGLLKKDLPPAVTVAAKLTVVAALFLCGMVLANTGHLGGRLVHELGVQAWFGG
jgi:uncharacterized membrane protein